MDLILIELIIHYIASHLFDLEAFDIYEIVVSLLFLQTLNILTRLFLLTMNSFSSQIIDMLLAHCIFIVLTVFYTQTVLPNGIQTILHSIGVSSIVKTAIINDAAFIHALRFLHTGIADIEEGPPDLINIAYFVLKNQIISTRIAIILVTL